MDDTARISRALGKLFIDTASAEELGAKVRHARAELGLSVAELASRSGVSTNTVRIIEAGKSNAKLNTLIGIALALYGDEISS